jgi:hypothetical protein
MHVDSFWLSSFVGRLVPVFGASFGGWGWGSRSCYSNRRRLYGGILLSPCFLNGSEFCSSLFNYRWVMIVFWSLLVNRKSVASGDVAVEVVTCWSYCNPIVVSWVSCGPPEFYPATAFSIKCNRVIPLGCLGFGVIADRFFSGHSASLYCPPPNSSD